MSDNVFLPGRNNFDIGIVSFGLPDKEFAGSAPESWQSFAHDELVGVQDIVGQLIKAGLNYEIRPFNLGESPGSNFMGKVIFSDGWALKKVDEDSAVLAQGAVLEVPI